MSTSQSVAQHSSTILATAPSANLIAFDRDPAALEAARARLAPFGDRVKLVHARFGTIEAALAEMGIDKVAGICADLGVSSPQIDDPQRGMSFRHEGPLDMRMDPSSGETALELIERLTEEQLADVIFHAGDERRSRRIARSIKRAAKDRELGSTLDLRRAIVRAVGPMRVGGIDPATRTFQALRIALNDELGEIDRLLQSFPRIVKTGGVAAVISFHSLEDRIVKTFIARESRAEVDRRAPFAPPSRALRLKSLGRVKPGADEVRDNPRARSAILRVAERIDG